MKSVKFRDHKNTIYYVVIGLIVLLGGILRIYFANFEREIVIGTDESSYMFCSKNILKYCTITYDRYGEIFNGLIEATPTITMQIGYPLYLAIFYFFNFDNSSIFLSQIFLSVINIVLVWKIMELVGINKKIIIFILVIFTLYPGNIYNINRLLTENLFTTLFLTFLFFWYTWINKKKYIYLVISSIFLTMSIFVRGSSLPFLFLSIMYILIYSKEKIKSMIYLMNPFILMMIPWIIRNYLVFNKFYVLTLAGENPKIWGAMPYYLDMDSANGKTLSELICSSLSINSFLFIRWRVFGFFNYMFRNVWDESIRHEYLGELLFIHYFVIFSVLLIPIIFYKKDKKTLFLGGIVLGWIILLLPYHALPRYIFPIIPLLFILLGEEIQIICKSIQKKKYKYKYLNNFDKFIWRFFCSIAMIGSILIFYSVFIFSYEIKTEMSEWRLNKYCNTSISNIKSEAIFSKKYVLKDSVNNFQKEIKGKEFITLKDSPAILELPVDITNKKEEKVITKVTMRYNGGYLFDYATIYWHDGNDGIDTPKFNENKVYSYPVNLFQKTHTVYIDSDINSLIIIPYVFANNKFNFDSITIEKYTVQ